MNWECLREDQFQEAIERSGGVCVLPLGCLERHGAYCPVGTDSLKALRHVIYGDPKRLYSFRLGEEALRRFSGAAEAFAAAQLERGFRTLDFYKSLQTEP